MALRSTENHRIELEPGSTSSPKEVLKLIRHRITLAGFQDDQLKRQLFEVITESCSIDFYPAIPPKMGIALKKLHREMDGKKLDQFNIDFERVFQRVVPILNKIRASSEDSTYLMNMDASRGSEFIADLHNLFKSLEQDDRLKIDEDNEYFKRMQQVSHQLASELKQYHKENTSGKAECMMKMRDAIEGLGVRWDDVQEDVDATLASLIGVSEEHFNLRGSEIVGLGMQSRIIRALGRRDFDEVKRLIHPLINHLASHLNGLAAKGLSHIERPELENVRQGYKYGIDLLNKKQAVQTTSRLINLLQDTLFALKLMIRTQAVIK